MIVGHEIVGTGPRKVIALHGWFGDHRVWTPVYKFLDKAKFSYAFMDYRGYGESRALAGEHTIAEIASDVVALADHLGWSRFCALGHSMGGMAVQRVGVDAPERVQAIVCVTPVSANGARFPPDVQKVFESVVSDDAVGKEVLDVSLGKRLTPAVAGYVLRFTRETTAPEAFSAYLQAFSKTNFAAEAKSIKAPMLVMPGEFDGGETVEIVRTGFSQLYPHARIEVIPNSGHYPMLEAPAYLVTRIEAFLSQL